MSAKMAAESGRGWHSQVTLASGAEQRHRRPVREHRVTLDRNRVVAVEPVPAHLEHEAEHAHGVDRLLDAVAREGLADADLDSDVRPVQPGERVLVGDVVTQVEDGAGRRLSAERRHGGALVGGEERKLDRRSSRS